MTQAEGWRRAQELFLEVVEAAPGDRPALMQDRCGDDAVLRSRVEALLAADARGMPELDATPVDLLGLMDDEPGEVDQPVDADHHEVQNPRANRPDRIGPYRTLEEIGRGGMGVVYRGVREDRSYTRDVALKVMSASLAGTELRAEATSRFQRECQILATLEHAGIGRLYDAGVADDGRPWMAMELVHGTPIHRYCDDRRMTVAERLLLFEQVTEAVDYAHRQLIIHRDLKPSNILVTDDGVVKLLDFGIAKLLPGAGAPGDPDAAPTRAGRRILTPEYASPEQLKGEALGTASDVYSLGVLLHQLLTGRRPVRDRFTGTHSRSPSATVASTRPPTNGTPSPQEVARRRNTTASGLVRALNGELDAILLTALREEPENRYPSAAALRADLVRWREGRPLTARAPTVGYRLVKFVRRNWVPVGASGMVLLSLVVGLGAAIRQTRLARAERDAATAVSDFLEGLFEASNRFAPGERRDTLPVSAFLDEAVEDLDVTLADQPELHTRMRRILGTVYENLGAYERADPLLQGVTNDPLAPKEDRRAARLSLARMAMGRSDFPAAAALYRQVLDATVAEYGPGSPQVADVQLELAGALLNGDGMEEAERLIHAALSAREGTFGEDALAVSGSLNMLGALHFRQGRLDEAVASMRRAVELVRTEVDPDHPQAAIMEQNLGLVLLRSDRPQEAEPILGRSVGILRRTMGPDFPYLGSALKAWAHALDALDRWEEAEPAFEEAMAHGRRVTPGRAAEMEAILDYGRALADHGRWDDGLALLEEAFEAAERLDIPPAATAAATALAEGHRAAGDLASAARWEAIMNGRGQSGR